MIGFFKNIFNNFTHFVVTHKHALLLFYYLVWVFQFGLVENINQNVTTWLWCPLDYKIPFVSVFVIPYILWFPFIGVVLTAFVFIDRKEFLQVLMNIYIGMSICLIIYLAFPHGQPLRAALTGNEQNIFDRMVYMLYSSDTPTNCAPSIHVLNSVAVTAAVTRSDFFRKRKFWIIAANILNVLIIASTVLIKQHSIIDVLLGLAMSIVMQFVIYNIKWDRIFANLKTKIRKRATQVQ